MANANKLTLFIVIFMLAGILSGAVIHSYASPGVVTAWGLPRVVTTAFSCSLML